jgi:hypothetical protein
MTNEPPLPITEVVFHSGSDSDRALFLHRIRNMNPAERSANVYRVTTPLRAELLLEELTAGMSDEAELHVNKLRGS